MQQTWKDGFVQVQICSYRRKTRNDNKGQIWTPLAWATGTLTAEGGGCQSATLLRSGSCGVVEGKEGGTCDGRSELEGARAKM